MMVMAAYTPVTVRGGSGNYFDRRNLGAVSSVQQPAGRTLRSRIWSAGVRSHEVWSFLEFDGVTECSIDLLESGNFWRLHEIRGNTREEEE